ncbi:uncharacterized protein LOC124491276 isoform X3 [Dermatophagoides farinae]|uniref:uncharacterized protein LOC124491276 isoform X3 n=1 Tax=Dermatophagoides farinae TaxID=6954 RepID=UPI003F629E67
MYASFSFIYQLTSSSPLSVIRSSFLLSMIIVMNLIYPIRMLSNNDDNGNNSILVKQQQLQHMHLNNIMVHMDNTDIEKNSITAATRASSINMTTTTLLSETLESVAALLLSKSSPSTTKSFSSSLLSSAPKSISIKERNRLIRMVDKVVKLANEILDLNYTTTAAADNMAMSINNNSVQDSNERNLDHTNELIDNVNDGDDDDPRFNRRKNQIGYDLLQEMIERSNHLKGLVTDMIRKNLIKDCLRLKIPNIFRLPDPPHNNMSKSMIIIYQTLANQTAHLYSLWNQHRRYSDQKQQNPLNDCWFYRHHVEMIATKQQQRKRQRQSNTGDTMIPGSVDNHNDDGQTMAIATRIKEKRLMTQENFFAVSDNLRSLLCYLNQAIHLFQIPVPIEQIIHQVLSHGIDSIERQQRSCSRQSIFECQLMRDAVQLLNDLEQFLRNESHRFLATTTK